MFNLIAKKISRPQKINHLITKISKAIEREEDKIRSNHGIGGLKIRATGTIAQLIWRRVDFIEFDEQLPHQPEQDLTGKKIQLHFNASMLRLQYPQKNQFTQRKMGFYIALINILARKIKKN